MTLVEAATQALKHMERNECCHENVTRAGVIWTICEDCGKKWSDDRNPFTPYEEPAVITNLRDALKNLPMAGAPDVVYGVYVNRDLTEGRGPEYLHSVWADEDDAWAWVEKHGSQLSVMGYRPTEGFREDYRKHGFGSPRVAPLSVIPKGLDPDELEGVKRYRKGERLMFSTDISGAISYGYGNLDDNGFWEFPVPFSYLSDADKRIVQR